MSGHRSRLCHFVIDVDDLDKGVAFWAAALDATEEQLTESSRHVYRRLRLPDSDIRVLLQLTHDEKCGKERMHLDLETDDVEAEVQRLEALGVTRWDHQQERGHNFWVLRDPWANEFCVLQPEFAELLTLRRLWCGPSTAEGSHDTDRAQRNMLGDEPRKMADRSEADVDLQRKKNAEGLGVGFGLIFGGALCLVAPSYVGTSHVGTTIWLVIGGVISLVGVMGTLMSSEDLSGKNGLSSVGIGLGFAGVAGILHLLQLRHFAGWVDTGSRGLVVFMAMIAAIGFGMGLGDMAVASRSQSVSQRSGEDKPKASWGLKAITSLAAIAGFGTALLNFMAALQG